MSQQHDILASLQEVEMDAGTVFSGTPSGTPVKGYAQPSPFTPTLNPDYVFHEHKMCIRDSLRCSLAHGLGMRGKVLSDGSECV